VSELLQQGPCCPEDACCEPINTQIPGPAGSDGAAGAAGAAGVSAFTTLTAGFTMPAELGNVVATVGATSWMVLGQVLYVQTAGWMRVAAIGGATSVTLTNLENTATGIYAENAAPATAIPNGSKVSPGGLQGPTGAATASALLAANNLSDVLNAGTSRTNLGLGSAALLTAAQVFQVANNLNEGVAATMRTNLGLGTMAVQSAAAVAITGGALNGTLGLTTPAAAVVTSLAVSALGGLNLGPWTQTGQDYRPQSATQSLLAATAIAPNAAKIAVIGNGGAVTLTATPTITNPPTDGQLLLIKGTSAANTVTLQDETSLAGTRLKLGGATRLLGLNDTILLSWDAAVSLWSEVAFTNVV
jgi:hypothetical protein